MHTATTHLLEACSTSDASADTVRKLVQKFGADLSTCDDVRCLVCTATVRAPDAPLMATQLRNTPAHLAGLAGNAEVAAALLELGATAVVSNKARACLQIGLASIP